MQEFLGGKVVHEVLGSDVTSIFLIFLGNDLLKLFADGLRDHFEEERQGLFGLVSMDVLSKLLVDFLNNSGAPSSNLIVNKVYFLAKLISLLFLFLLFQDLLVKISNLG